MTPLRQRMLDALVLRGMALRTQESYIDCVARTARHFGRSPELLSEHEVQHFLLHLLRERQLSRSTVNQYGCALRFLYGKVLEFDGQAFHIPLGIAPQRLPEILSREELARLFAVTTYDKARTFLMLAYGTGLRLSELCRLRVADIDSHADRMCIRVEQGKGGKDRYVPLAEDVLQLLRQWWRCAHPTLWLFGGAGDGSRPINDATAQKWYQAARSQAGIYPSAGASTRCATAMPRTCWRPGSTCTACRSGWATATSAPPRAICIWPGWTRPMALAAIHSSCWQRCLRSRYRSPRTDRPWPPRWPRCCGTSGPLICARTG